MAELARQAGYKAGPLPFIAQYCRLSKCRPSNRFSLAVPDALSTFAA